MKSKNFFPALMCAVGASLLLWWQVASGSHGWAMWVLIVLTAVCWAGVVVCRKSSR